MKNWLKILSLIREKKKNLIGPIGISNYNDDGLDSSIAPGVLQQMKLNSFRC